MTEPGPVARPRLKWSRITRKYLQVPLSATLAGGTTPAEITAVDIALLPQRTPVDGATSWTAADYDPDTEVATVLGAAPDANPTGALVVPEGGADVYARVLDTPEVDVVLVGHIDIDDFGA